MTLVMQLSSMRKSLDWESHRRRPLAAVTEVLVHLMVRWEGNGLCAYRLVRDIGKCG